MKIVLSGSDAPFQIWRSSPNQNRGLMLFRSGEALWFLSSAINLGLQGSTRQVWQHFSLTFTATKSRTAIAFFAGTAPVGGNIGIDSLDNISLQLLPTSAGG